MVSTGLTCLSDAVRNLRMMMQAQSSLLFLLLLVRRTVGRMAGCPARNVAGRLKSMQDEALDRISSELDGLSMSHKTKADVFTLVQSLSFRQLRFETPYTQPIPTLKTLHVDRHPIETLETPSLKRALQSSRSLGQVGVGFADLGDSFGPLAEQLAQMLQANPLNFVSCEMMMSSVCDCKQPESKLNVQLGKVDLGCFVKARPWAASPDLDTLQRARNLANTPSKFWFLKCVLG